MRGLTRRGRAEKEDSRDRLEKERRQAAQEYSDVRKDPSWCVDVGGGSGSRGVNVTPVVAGGDTDQAPCNLGWYVCMYGCTEYVCVCVCPPGRAGWLPCLTGCLSISRNDMDPAGRYGAAQVLSCLQHSARSAVCILHSAPSTLHRAVRVESEPEFCGILPLPSSWCRAPAPNNSIC